MAGVIPAHLPVLLDEVLRCLEPRPGDLAVDCTLGGGGHAQALLERIRPGGRLLGIDVDPIELARAEARLGVAGFGSPAFVARCANFRDLRRVLLEADFAAADVILADLGVSSMQVDDVERGFNFRGGPFDMRMDPTRGETAAALVARLSEPALARMLEEHADEPHAHVIARALAARPPETTAALDRLVRATLKAGVPHLTKPDVTMTVRRTFQALRIAVNDELAALDALLDALPHCLAPGGRVAVLTFHAGEDRRVEQSLLSGRSRGLYSAVALDALRSTIAETRANRRAASAKLRWAIRAGIS